MSFTSLADALRQFVDDPARKHHVEQACWAQLWRTAVPAEISQRTRSVVFRQGKLIVQLTSAPLRHALVLQKNVWLAKLQQNTSAQSVSDLRFV